MAKDFESLSIKEDNPTLWLKGTGDEEMAADEKTALQEYRSQLVQEIALVDNWLAQCDELLTSIKPTDNVCTTTGLDDHHT